MRIEYLANRKDLLPELARRVMFRNVTQNDLSFVQTLAPGVTAEVAPD